MVLVLVAVAATACDSDPPVSRPVASPPVQSGPTQPSLPPVASVAPQPETVAASFREPVTITGSDLFGTESVTVEVTLSEPELVRELDLDTGVTIRPQREVWAVFALVLEGVEGRYEFNPLDFHLVPAAEVAEFQENPFEFELNDPTDPTSLQELDAIGSGPVSASDRLRGNLVYDVSESTLDGAAVLMEPPLLVQGPPAAYWQLP
jgi:hypothetical protein